MSQPSTKSFVTDGRYTPLAGKHAIVTGGAMGIGFAIARKLADQGASVSMWDINGEGIAAAAEQLRGAGLEATAFTVDVADRSQIDTAVAASRAAYGSVDVLVNNAGIDCARPFLDTDHETLMRVMTINLIGLYHCTQAVVPDMIASKWGRIVNVSSSSAQRGAKGMSAYAASKGGVISLTKSLALELGVHGITVNNVPPGFIETPMLHKVAAEGQFGPRGIQAQVDATPVGRVGQPDDIAAACAFLASPEAGYITGQTLGVNGGRVTQ